MGVDHYGKSIEAGTRGSSAKEAAADAVVAILGERRQGGVVDNRRMAVTKLRGAETGRETGFTLDVQKIGVDKKGRPKTTCRVLWAETETGPRKRPLSNSADTAKQILTTLINETGGPSAPETGWRQACIDNPRFSTAAPKGKALAFSRAYTALLDAKAIHVRDKQVFLGPDPKEIGAFDALVTG